MNSYPVICWQNVSRTDPAPTVTNSTDATGYPIENVWDWREYTHWKSSDAGALYIKLDADPIAGDEITVDSLAIAGHNFGSVGVTGLKLQYSDDDVDYHDCHSAIDPADDQVIFRKFTAQTHRYFKLVIPSGYSSAPEIGVLFIGSATEIPSYPDAGFDPDAQEADLAAEYGRTGRLLGVATRFRRREIQADFSRLPASFIHDQWVPFFREHGAMPFFFAWDPEGKPDEAYLVRLATPRLEAPYERAFRSLSLTMTGVAP